MKFIRKAYCCCARRTKDIITPDKPRHCQKVIIFFK